MFWIIQYFKSKWLKLIVINYYYKLPFFLHSFSLFRSVIFADVRPGHMCASDSTIFLNRMYWEKKAAKNEYDFVNQMTQLVFL